MVVAVATIIFVLGSSECLYTWFERKGTSGISIQILNYIDLWSVPTVQIFEHLPRPHVLIFFPVYANLIR